MKFFLLVIFLLFSFTICFADWPVKRGRLQLVPTYSMYHASNYFNSYGRITSQANTGDHYTTNYFGLYSMYGISDRLDLLINIPLISQKSVFSGNTLRKFGLGDLSVGLAYHIPSLNLKNFFTIKGAFIFPGYQNAVSPYLGYASKAFQLGAAYSYNSIDKVFIDADAYYTRYFDEDTGPSLFSLGGTLGYYLDKWDKILINLTHQVAISSDKNFSNNLAVNKYFTDGRITLGYSRRITRTITPSAQFYFTPYGYNAGAGTGILLSCVIRFP